MHLMRRRSCRGGCLFLGGTGRRHLTEDGADAGDVELGAAVVAVDAVLLLFHVCELGIAVASDVFREPQHRIDMGFEARVEVFY